MSKKSTLIAGSKFLTTSELSDICTHKNLVPFEIAFAKIMYPNGPKEPAEYDYSSSIFNANVAHVKRYLCTSCHKIIRAPNIYDCDHSTGECISKE